MPKTAAGSFKVHCLAVKVWDGYRFMARAAWIGIGRDCTEVTKTILYWPPLIWWPEFYSQDGRPVAAGVAGPPSPGTSPAPRRNRPRRFVSRSKYRRAVTYCQSHESCRDHLVRVTPLLFIHSSSYDSWYETSASKKSSHREVRDSIGQSTSSSMC